MSRVRTRPTRDATRERLFEAAAQVFDERGIGAASIEAIAAAAGFTRGAVYSNFASKDDLFLATLERQVIAEMQALQEALSAEETIDGRLAVVGRWYASQAGQGRRRTRVLAELAVLSGRPSGAHERLHEQRKLLNQAVAALLRQQEVELGIEFRLPLPTLATAVQALLEGFALGSAIDDDVDTAALTAALELLLRPATPPD